MNRLVSFWVLVAIIVAVSLVFYRVMADFLLPLFLASLLVVLFAPLHRRVAQRCGDRPRLAAGISTTIVVGCIFLPLLWTLSLAVTQSISLVRRMDVHHLSQQLHRLRDTFELDVPMYEEVVELTPAFSELRDPASANTAVLLVDLRGKFDQLAEQFPDRATVTDPDSDPLRSDLTAIRAALMEAARGLSADGGASFEKAIARAEESFIAWSNKLPRGWVRLNAKRTFHPSPERLDQWRRDAMEKAQTWLLPAANATAEFVFQGIFGAIIMVVSVYFFFVDGPTMVAGTMRLIPLDMRHQRELFDDFVSISRAVVLATLVSAIGQGVLAGIGFWMAGSDAVALLGLLTIVFSMIPFVGAMAVWLPVCFWIGLVDGRPVAALVLAAYCAIIVSQADNVIKPWMLRGQSNLHPLLALLSILGGVKALGPIGILVGPMVVVFLQTLLKILQREMADMGKEAASTLGAAEPAPAARPG